jgi:hypothetical protein
MSGHTPGPWTIIPAEEYDGDEDEFEGSYTSPASIEGADGNPVCVFGSAEGSGCLFENEADYCLIAAAPDLLAALVDVIAALREEAPGTPLNNHRFDALGMRAHAAIARATGAS